MSSSVTRQTDPVVRNTMQSLKHKARIFLGGARRFFVPDRPERFFLHWFLLVSVVLCFVLPPFMGPDEASHVYRAYEFSKGHLLLQKIGDGYGYRIPDSMVQLNQDQFWSNAHQPFLSALKHNFHSHSVNDPHTTVQYFEATSTYSPIGYLHFILMTWVSQLLSLNAYVNITLLRLANIALYATLGYFAIRLMPKRRWFLVMAALLPMAIHQASVVSPDAVINGCALLTVAMVAKLLVAKRFPGYKYLGVLALATLLVAFNKQAYVFFPLILLVVPAKAFTAPISKTKYVLGVWIMVLACLGIWTLASSTNTSTSFNVWRQRENFGQTRTTLGFARYVLTEPANATTTFLHSFVYNIAPQTQVAQAPPPEFFVHNHNADFTWDSLLGSFGSLMIGYPIWVYLIVVGGLTVPLLAEDYTFLERRRWRLLVGGVVFLQFMTITAALWIKWTSPTDPAIIGVQGRYLLPLVGLLVFLPSKRFASLILRKDLLSPLLASTVFVEAAMMLIVVSARFYTNS